MRWILACFALVLVAALGACASHEPEPGANEFVDISAIGPSTPLSAGYKSDILAMLRVYVADPTDIRQAAISGAAPVAGRARRRQMVCLRFDAKTRGGNYSGLRERIAVFSNGRLDQMAEAAPNQCAAAVYEPFPEAERLTR